MMRVRIADHFSELADPRKRQIMHSLLNVITIANCAVIAGEDDFVAIADDGRKKNAWLGAGDWGQAYSRCSQRGTSVQNFS